MSVLIYRYFLLEIVGFHWNEDFFCLFYVQFRDSTLFLCHAEAKSAGFSDKKRFLKIIISAFPVFSSTFTRIFEFRRKDGILRPILK